jgi:hypothetical protein
VGGRGDANIADEGQDSDDLSFRSGDIIVIEEHGRLVCSV